MEVIGGTSPEVSPFNIHGAKSISRNITNFVWSRSMASILDGTD